MKRTFFPRLLVSLISTSSIACGTSSASDVGDMNSAAPNDGGVVDADGATAALDGGATVSSDGEVDAGGHLDAAVVDAATAGDANGGTGARLAIPMYLDPTQSEPLWTQVFGAGDQVGILVVSTDTIGPGTSVDSSYTAAISNAHAAGQLVLGYTYTGSASRAIADVRSDVDDWYSFYPALDGIFVDEVSDDSSTANSYYAPLYTYIKAKGANVTVAINPGTMVDEAFMSASDILLTYEDTYGNFIDPSQNPPNPAWVATYPSSRFWNIVLSTDASVEAAAIELAKGRNAGWIYVTAEGPDTAYQSIETGTYWTTELADVTAP